METKNERADRAEGEVMKLEVGKYYKTRNGRVVHIYSEREQNLYPYLGLRIDTGEIDSYTRIGSFLCDEVDNEDLIEECDRSGNMIKECSVEDLAEKNNKLVENFCRWEKEQHKALNAARYESLRRVLRNALTQASEGKGNERHANGLPFEQQPIMEIGRVHGLAFNTGQAEKKTREALGMLARGQSDAAVRELLGAIVYLASAVLLIDEEQSK